MSLYSPRSVSAAMAPGHVPARNKCQRLNACQHRDDGLDIDLGEIEIRVERCFPGLGWGIEWERDSDARRQNEDEPFQRGETNVQSSECGFVRSRAATSVFIWSKRHFEAVPSRGGHEEGVAHFIGQSNSSVLQLARTFLSIRSATAEEGKFFKVERNTRCRIRRICRYWSAQ
jgi:hypothetical protein